MADKPATAGPSSREASLFFSILTNMKDKTISLASAVDWDAVAEDTGYNSGSTARVRYNQIRRDLEKKKGSASGDEKTPTKAKAPAKAKSVKADKPSKVTKTKKEPPSKKTPAKKVAKGKGIKKEPETKEEDEANDEEFDDAPEEAAEDQAHEDEDEEK